MRNYLSKQEQTAASMGRDGPAAHLAGFKGILQVDGYGAYASLAECGDVVLTFCWSHVRRRFYEIQAASPAPIAAEALVRIGALYAIEADIRGCSAEERQRVRFSPSKPLVDALKPWFESQLAAVSGKSTIAEAIRYALTRWDGLTRFLDDGRVEIDSNAVERAFLPAPWNKPLMAFACATTPGPTTHSRATGDFLNRRQMPAIDRLSLWRAVSANAQHGLRCIFGACVSAAKFPIPGKQRRVRERRGSMCGQDTSVRLSFS